MVEETGDCHELGAREVDSLQNRERVVVEVVEESLLVVVGGSHSSREKLLSNVDARDRESSRG